ncbi:MAG: ATP-binding cassette domain-containing protein [Clostridia bacterium]|nr:ATP-binding cassette domain-containing protein [Clostridia bacterium]
MIQVQNLEKYFKKTVKQPGLKGSVKSLFRPQTEIVKAVNDITFHVDKGEILGFIGPNGAGKSTVIKMLTGILSPTGGSCIINGQDPRKNRKRYVKEIGVVFGQRTQLWWDLPLGETYTVLKEIYEIDDERYKKQMAFLDEVLELQSFIKTPVRTLSLGQRMRADIAASLLHNPKVLFLDEPTIGLDVVVKDNIRKAVTFINQQEGTTVILTTHDLDDISTLCKRIVMIDHGKKVYDGSLYNLKQKYGHMRELNFEAADKSAANKLDYATAFGDCGLEEGDLTVKTEGAMFTVNFNTDKIPVEKMLNYTLGKIHVKDVNLKDADIEEIIRRLYKGEVKEEAASASE